MWLSRPPHHTNKGRFSVDGSGPVASRGGHLFRVLKKIAAHAIFPLATNSENALNFVISCLDGL